MENPQPQSQQTSVNSNLSATPQQTPLTPTQSPSHSSTKMLVVFLLILLPVIGIAGYYFGQQKTQINQSADKVKVSPTISSQPVPTESGQQQIACTLDAKVCPDGSSVGRNGPNCEFAECPEVTKTVGDKKTFEANSNFPGSFKLFKGMYTADKIAPDGYYHIFISNNSITIPDMWDSPFSPVDIQVVAQNTTSDNYSKKIEEAKNFYLKETLVTQPIVAGKRKGIYMSGTFGDGYAGGEKVSQAFFETENGYIKVIYYPFVDKNFTESTFKEIMLTFDLQ